MLYFLQVSDGWKSEDCIDICSSSDEEEDEGEGKKNYDAWKRINGADGGRELRKVLDYKAIEKIAIQNMQGSRKPSGGGGDSEKKCEGAVFGDRRGQETEKIVKVSVSEMQPVRMHKDEMQGNSAPPESIHQFGPSVCWILGFVKKLL